MHIRLYRPEDREVLKDITTRTFGPFSIDGNIEKQFGLLNGTDWAWRKRRHIDADCDAQPDGILVAEEEGRVLGYITTRFDSATRLGWIPNMAVEPDCQGRGIGRQLIEAALALFRRRGMTHAKIETLAQNPVGQNLYPDCGFQEVARQVHYVMKL
ncbi:MAG: GNAT family N-acetyltransferase [Verrucomicrobia bacterium]|nr:GNAT family N-acetyltransferase [Verrucomicrobiota bacterium]